MVFHDRRLQYTEHQQLEGWRWNRPGDRILDIGEFPWQHFGWCWRRCGCLKCPQPGSQSLDFKGQKCCHDSALCETWLVFLYVPCESLPSFPTTNGSLFSISAPTDIPMSVGIIDPRANPTQLNTVEFLWDPSKRTSVFIQVREVRKLLLWGSREKQTNMFSNG